jgi:hypothetical protein
MDRSIRFAVLAGALALGACQQQPSKSPGGTSDIERGRTLDPAAPPAAPSSPPSPTPGATPSASSSTSGENDGQPDLTPAPLTSEAEKGMKGARNIVLAWARAIELREFDQAWAMMSPRDHEKWSKAEFARMFADLGKITVAVPTGETDGAAGSIYYTGAVTITANDAEGRPVRYEGETVLRRVNDVDGATPAQLRWHFDHVTLDWTH